MNEKENDEIYNIIQKYVNENRGRKIENDVLAELFKLGVDWQAEKYKREKSILIELIKKIGASPIANEELRQLVFECLYILEDRK